MEQLSKEISKKDSPSAMNRNIYKDSHFGFSFRFWPKLKLLFGFGIGIGFGPKEKWLFWQVSVLAEMKKSLSVLHYF